MCRGKISRLENVIDCFDGEYSFLSNFYECKIKFNGITYNHAEGAFQAQKTLDENERLKFVNITAGQSKRLGKKVKLRDDWETVKLGLMYYIVFEKFNQNKDICEKLIATKDAKLIEGNYWHDYFWGVCNGKGRNELGKTLMMVREAMNIYTD